MLDWRLEREFGDFSEGFGVWSGEMVDEVHVPK